MEIKIENIFNNGKIRTYVCMSVSCISCIQQCNRMHRSFKTILLQTFTIASKSTYEQKLKTKKKGTKTFHSFEERV